jgi:hypothetical protein
LVGEVMSGHDDDAEAAVALVDDSDATLARSAAARLGIGR